MPYRDWAAFCLGLDVCPPGGMYRNHYDRFVHFCSGFLMLLLMSELVHRHVVRSSRWAVVVGVAFVAVLRKAHELDAPPLHAPYFADLSNGYEVSLGF